MSVFEVWKPFNDRYSVSTLGRVKGNYKGRGIILRPGITPNGYEGIIMSIGQKRKNITVHRLVAKVFIGIPEDRLVVNHKDGDKTNNMLYNLEVCTQSHNRKHAFFGKKRFVSYNSEYNKYKVDIRNKEKKQIFFGYFNTKEEAYEVARNEYFNMYGNFPWSDK